MDETLLRKALSELPLGGVRVFDQIGSTNDAAMDWAAGGAPDLALVYAEEQTSGRGRGKRHWYTAAETSLAFSLVLRPQADEEQSVLLFSGLGAVAVCDALRLRGLVPEIKWPNDVLLNRRKVCGILAEAVWMGEKVQSIVLGIGVNVRPEAIPPTGQLNFPATCVETEMGESVNRLSLLKDILQAMISWRSLLKQDVFLRSWQKHLAFRGERVEIRTDEAPVKVGQVDGLERDGSLRLRSGDGHVFTVQFGEVYVRPVM